MIRPLGPQDDDLAPRAPGAPLLVEGLVLLLGGVFLAGMLRAGPEGYTAFVSGASFRPSAGWWPGLVSHVFVHADWQHLLANGAFLYILGGSVERALGTRRMLLLLAAGWLGGAAAHALAGPTLVLHAPDGIRRSSAPLVGSSAALMGLVGGMLPTMIGQRVRAAVGGLGRWRVVSCPAWLLVAAFFGKELLSALTRGPGETVAYHSHLGGIAAGAVVAFFLPQLGALGAAAARALGLSTWSTPESMRGPMAPALPREYSGIELPAPKVETDDLELDLPEVPADQDLSQVSGVWAPSMQLADLQARFARARRLEREHEGAASAVQFYREVMCDRDNPPGYRALAGARVCRMLLRSRRYADSLNLAEKLLRAKLAPELAEHVRQTAEAARAKKDALG